MDWDRGLPGREVLDIQGVSERGGVCLAVREDANQRGKARALIERPQIVSARTTFGIVIWAALILGTATGSSAAEDQATKEELSSQMVAPPEQGWKSLVISSARIVKSDLTIPSNVCLRFEDGGTCDVREGATLTINGPIDAPLARVFPGKGDVCFGPGHVKEAYPQWWGAHTDDDLDDTAAIQAAIDSMSYKGQYSKEHVPPNTGIVCFPSGSYTVSTTLRLYDGTTLKGGAAPDRTELRASRPLPAILQRPDLTAPPEGSEYNYNARISGVRISTLQLNGKGSSVGLDMTNVGYSLIEDVIVRECKTGILLGGLAMHNSFRNINVYTTHTGIEVNKCAEHGSIFGGSVSKCEIGISIRMAQGWTVYGTSFETYKNTGIDVQAGDSVNLDYLWFSARPPATAIRIAPEASACSIINPRFHGTTPRRIDDRASDTLIQMPKIQTPNSERE